MLSALHSLFARPASRLGACIAVSTVLAACGGGSGGSGSAPDAAPVDPRDAASGGDSTDPGGCRLAPGDLAVGTNAFESGAAESFAEAATGADMTAVMGFQGTFMIVAAVRTQLIPDCRQTVDVTVTLGPSGGTPWCSLSLRDVAVIRSGGVAYIQNVYCEIGEERGVWEGKAAAYSVRLGWGPEEAEGAVDVRLLADDRPPWERGGGVGGGPDGGRFGASARVGVLSDGGTATPLADGGTVSVTGSDATGWMAPLALLLGAAVAEGAMVVPYVRVVADQAVVAGDLREPTRRSARVVWCRFLRAGAPPPRRGRGSP